MSLLMPDRPASSATSLASRYRPELSWDQIVSAEIASVTSSMRRNARWSIDRNHRQDSLIQATLNQQNHRQNNAEQDDSSSPHLTAGRTNGASGSNAYDYLADISLRESSGLEYLRMFTDLASRRDPSLRAGPFPTLPESLLLQGFSRLKARLTIIQNLRDLDPLHLLDPFLNVIKSGETNGHITGVALESVETFINYRVLDPHHPDLSSAVVALADAVTHCRFEGTDIVSDEVVLSRVLRLFRTIVLSDAGKKCLDDKSLCAMVEVSFGIHYPSRISEMLRKSAEETLLVLVQSAFERLAVITKEREHRQTLKSKVSMSRGLRNHASSTLSEDYISPLRYGGLENETSQSELIDFNSSPNRQQKELTNSSQDLTAVSSQPFGLPAILEITRVLITLIDPSNRTQTDSLHRVLGLRLLRRGLEISGKSLGKWIGFGYAVSEQLKKTPEKSRKPEVTRRTSCSMEMKITTEHPAQVVSVHPNGDMLHSDGLHRIVDVGSPQLIPELRNNEVTDITLDSTSLSDESEQPLLDKKTHETIASEQTLAPDITLKQDLTCDDKKPLLEDTEQDLENNASLLTTTHQELHADLHADFQRMAISLRDMITNDLCKHLFLLLYNSNVTFTNPPSWQTLSLLTQLLKTILALFNTVREYLFPQQQWLIQFLIQQCVSGVVGWDIEDWATPSGSFNDYVRSRGETSPVSGNQRLGYEIIVGEVREIYLETLLQLARSPSFFVDMYVYYDSDMMSSCHLFEELLGFLSKSSFPDLTPGGPATSSIHQAQCFDGLLLFLRRLVDRRNMIGRLPEVLSHNIFEPKPSNAAVSDLFSGTEQETAAYAPQTLVNNRKRKRIMSEGAAKFNASLKEGIKFFQEHGILPDPLTPISMAHFFAYTPNLSKKFIGEYFSKPQNVETLGLFVELFDFHGKRIDEAMRILLEKFRIPGESQQIERVMDAFSKWYFESIQDDPNREIATESDTAVLAFSVIMLNTDQHNPQVKRRMTFHDYSRNVRGLNSGKDFSIDYLREIYDAIKHTEIVMAEEQGGELSFNFKWRQILARAPEIVQLSNRDTTVYNKDMFISIWGPMLAAIFYTFDNAEDNMSLQKAIAGVQHCAVLASHYDLSHVFDYIIISLLRMTGLNKSSRVLPVEKDIAALQLMFEPQLLDTASLSDSELTLLRRRERAHQPDRWLVDFGGNYRGQAAAVLAFNLASDYGNTIRESWKHIIYSIGNLFLHQILPISLLAVEHFGHDNVLIPRVKPSTLNKQANEVTSTRKEAGIFSTLSQLLSLGSQQYNDDYDLHPDDIVYERMASECVTLCRIEELIADTRFLEEPTLTNLVTTLIEACYTDPVKMDGAHNSLADQQPLVKEPVASQDKVFSESCVFQLELLLNITLRNRDRIQILWPQISAHLMEVFSNPTFAPPAFLDHAVSCLLRLLLRLLHVEEIQTEIFGLLDKVSKFPADLMHAVGESLVAGLLSVLMTNISIVAKHQSRWLTVLHVLSATSSHPGAASFGFEAACLLVSNHPDSPVTADNFGECVDLLISFVTATASSTGAITTSTELQPLISNVQIGHVSGHTSPARVSVREQRSQTEARSPLLVHRAEPICSTQLSPLDRALMAIEKLYKLQTKIPKLIETTGIQSKRAWFEFWLPVLSGLSQLCYHPLREVRQQALTLLQRSLLSTELEMSLGETATIVSVECRVDCFDNVLYPLLDELLRPEVYRLNPHGIEETRVRAVALLSKIFLRFMPLLVNSKELPRIWVRILQYVCQFLGAGGRQRREFVVEGVQESLKNLLLVLSAEGILWQPKSTDNPADVNLWELTWSTIGQFLPSLQDELFPPTQVLPLQPAALSEALPSQTGQPADSGATQEASLPSE
ncbi:GDP/GTP exchange factor for ARF [Batrachochytrium dendrobatidis]